MVWEETIQLVPYNPLQTMQVCSSLLESSLRPNSFLKLYEDINIFIRHPFLWMLVQWTSIYFIRRYQLEKNCMIKWNLDVVNYGSASMIYTIRLKIVVQAKILSVTHKFVLWHKSTTEMRNTSDHLSMNILVFSFCLARWRLYLTARILRRYYKHLFVIILFIQKKEVMPQKHITLTACMLTNPPHENAPGSL